MRQERVRLEKIRKRKEKKRREKKQMQDLERKVREQQHRMKLLEENLTLQGMLTTLCRSVAQLLRKQTHITRQHLRHMYRYVTMILMECFREIQGVGSSARDVWGRALKYVRTIKMEPFMVQVSDMLGSLGLTPTSAGVLAVSIASALVYVKKSGKMKKLTNLIRSLYM